MKKINKMNKHILAVLAAGIAAVLIGFGSCDTGANPAAEDAKEALRGTVAITGTAKVGETLTADISGVTNGTGTAAYQWKRDGQNIAGATSGTYLLTGADNGKAITLVVSFSGNTGSLTSAATAAVTEDQQGKDALQGTVSITGTAKVGETLTAYVSGITNGTGTVAYVWKRGNDVIAGETGDTYVLTGADTGENITVTVSFSGNSGSITSNPTATVQPKDQTKETLQGTVAITGTAKVGEVLTADISGITNGTGTAEYQWKASGQNIAGATNTTYTLTGADNGKTITIVVSFSGNTGSLTSAATAAVQPAKEALQGTVAITGTAKVGETLTANITGITNGTGNATYQWKRGGQDIAGATNTTYTLTGADNGKTITIVVSFSGNSGNVTSNPTAAVQPKDQIVYGTIDNVFKVFQDDGVSDEQMATSFTILEEAYNFTIKYYKDRGITDPLLGKITEIHIIADKDYTWDDNTKILGVKQGLVINKYYIYLSGVHEGDIPPVAQLQKSARETVRMARLPQDGAAIAKQFAREIALQIEPSKAAVGRKKVPDTVLG
jgi:hypothetical protein